MKHLSFIVGVLLLTPFLAFAAPSSVDRVTDHIEPLIKTDFIKAQYFTATSTAASSTFPRLVATHATTTNATTTNFAISGGFSFGGILGSAWSDFCTSITGGAGLCDGNDASGGAGTGSNWQFTALQNAITPTSTVGILVNAGTSTINRLNINFSTTTSATTTNLNVASELKIASLSGLLKAVSGVVSTAIAGVDYINDSFRDWNMRSGALTPTTTVGIIVNASSTIDRLTVNNGTTTNATSTNLAISGDLFFNGVRADTWPEFCTAITGGSGLCDGDDATGGGGGTGSNWLFSAFQDAIRPSTTVGIIVNGASSTLQAVTMTNSTTTNATTTNLYVSDRLNLTNALAVSNGGTGLTTFGGVNHVLYTTAAGALASEAAFTYNPSTDTINTTKLSLTGTSGTIQHSASVDGGEYNYFVDTTGTLAFYGSAGATLNLNLLDGSLTITSLSSGILKSTSGLVGVAIPGVDYLSTNFRDWNIVGGSLVPTSTIGITVQSSSTISGLTMANSTTTNATSTVSLALSYLTSKILKTNSTGGVIGAVDGVDFIGPNFRDWNILNKTLAPTSTIGIVVQASSTISGLTMANSTSTNATTTNLAVTGETKLSSSFTGLLKAVSGAVSTAIAGVDYVSPFFNQWQITGGSLVPTSTIGITVQAASSTINGLTINVSTTTSATTTNLNISGGLTFNGVTGATWASFCTTITGSAGLCDGNDASGGGSFTGAQHALVASVDGSTLTSTSTPNFVAFNATSTTATSTLLGKLSVGSSTPSISCFFCVGTTSPTFQINSNGQVGFGAVNTGPTKFTFGNGTNINVNPNIMFMVQDVSDARMGVSVNDKFIGMKTIGGTNVSIFGFDYAGGVALPINLQEFGGNVGIGSSTPWANFSIAKAATWLTSPLFAFATSTSAWPMLWGTATSSLPGSIGGQIFINQKAPTTTARDNLYLGGRIRKTDINSQCQSVRPAISLTADSVMGGCPDWFFDVDADAQLIASKTPILINGVARHYTEFAGGVASPATGDTGGIVNTNIVYASSSPVFEATIALDSATSSNTRTRLGFGASQTITPGTSDWGTVAPVSGCYFEASSTVNSTWWVFCMDNALTAVTGVNTGVATTTITTVGGLATSTPQKLRLEVDTVVARAFINDSLVATITTNLPKSPMVAYISNGIVTAQPPPRWMKIFDFGLWADSQ